MDYVKEGMRIGIDDYLLKLDITPERLGSLLESVALKLQKQKRSGVELVSGERQKEREDFIRRWIRGEFTERDMIQDYLKFYGIKLNMHQLICLSILIEPEKQCAFTAEMSGYDEAGCYSDTAKCRNMGSCRYAVKLLMCGRML